jgi:hypothetical protein
MSMVLPVQGLTRNTTVGLGSQGPTSATQMVSKGACWRAVSRMYVFTQQ